MLNRTLAAAALLAAMTAALAQTAAPPTQMPLDFPPDSKALDPEDLSQRLAGKVFHVPMADGSSMRLQYQAAHYYVDTSRGVRVNGTWRAEGTRLCTDRANRGPACNEARLSGDRLYVKLDSGEVVKFEPR